MNESASGNAPYGSHHRQNYAIKITRHVTTNPKYKYAYRVGRKKRTIFKAFPAALYRSEIQLCFGSKNRILNVAIDTLCVIQFSAYYTENKKYPLICAWLSIFPAIIACTQFPRNWHSTLIMNINSNSTCLQYRLTLLFSALVPALLLLLTGLSWNSTCSICCGFAVSSARLPHGLQPKILIYINVRDGDRW